MGIKDHLTQSLLRLYKERIDQPYNMQNLWTKLFPIYFSLIYRIVRTGETPHVVNPLSVSLQLSGKLRLILDFRHVNQ